MYTQAKKINLDSNNLEDIEFSPDSEHMGGFKNFNKVNKRLKINKDEYMGGYVKNTNLYGGEPPADVSDELPNDHIEVIEEIIKDLFDQSNNFDVSYDGQKLTLKRPGTPIEIGIDKINLQIKFIFLLK